ncbi:tetratricopeptide repeat protein [Ferrimonas lipolytica]|uniref:Tetratricopeptide repeat protein n=1 Tax=Ferrimonas lipolytica TaxID=2724191 RepID=A0A6H1UA17_9GAMM|nr:tetratricopeptide repeat protein [Ferrimonas lipolytica]QIZ75430.1 tetratricopeptide repeat protein [Ferrimonas lipolytica]
MTLLLGCSATPHQQLAADNLWRDELFSGAEPVPLPADIFALNDDMRRVAASFRQGDHKQLTRFLRSDGELAYSGRNTRTAAETFASRSGNCMSLVIMTATLARAADIGYRYQLVQSPPVWDRQGGLYLINGHVNIQLNDGNKSNVLNVAGRSTTIDFLPGSQIRGYQVKFISESQLLARYYNNLAADALVEADYSRAYALLKAAYATEPDYQQLWNTLGVLYRRSGQEQMAEQVYRYAIELPQVSNDALYNLALLLARQERLLEWQQVHARLELQRIRNPYYYFDMGENAYQRGEYGNAVRYFSKAIKLADYRHEFHFGISRAYFSNGQLGLSQRHMDRAVELAPQNEKQRYQLKLVALQRH